MEKKYSLFYANIICGYSLIDTMYGASYILLMASLGISDAQITFILSFASFFLFIFDLPSGNFADIYGRKKATALGLLIWGVGLIGFSVSKMYSLLFIFSGVSALGVALYSGSPQAWYVDKLKEMNKLDYKNKILPFLGGVVSIFSAIGALLASFINSYSKNLTISIFLCGVFAIILGIFVSLLYEDNYGVSKSNNFFTEMIVTVIEFINDKSMNTLLVYNLLKGAPFTIFLLTWQIHAIKTLNYDVSIIGIMMVIFMLIQSFSGFLSSKLVERTTNINITIVGALMVAISFVLMVLAGDYKLFYFLALILIEFGLGLVFSNTGAWIQDLIPSDKRSTYYSTITATNSLFNFFTGMGLTLIIKLFSIKLAWMIASFIQLICMLYLLRRIKPIIDKVE